MVISVSVPVELERKCSLFFDIRHTSKKILELFKLYVSNPNPNSLTQVVLTR